METKPGIVTTEFWLVIIVNLYALLDYAEIWNVMPEKYVGIIQAVITAAYILSRGIAKSRVAPHGLHPGNYTLLPAAPPALSQAMAGEGRGGLPIGGSEDAEGDSVIHSDRD